MADDNTPRWYVVHTYSGYENKVKDNLEKTVKNDPSLQQLIFEVSVPCDEVIEIKNGKAHPVQRKRAPGYVFVRMIMTNRTWYVVRNVNGATGFVTTGDKATPMSDAEYAKMVAGTPKVELDVHVGDTVRVLNGSFKDIEAIVSKVNPETKRVTILTSMLGKEIDTELDMGDVVRIQY